MGDARSSADPTITGANVNLSSGNSWLPWVVVGVVAVVVALSFWRKK